MMRLAEATGVIALILVHGASPQSRDSNKPAYRWLLASPADKSEIAETTSLDDLVRRFGSSNVRRTRMDLGEGESSMGAVVFADDPALRFEVAWRDPSRSRLSFVRVRGDSSQWAVAPGISLGTSLNEVERLNGRPFVLVGFGFDGGGTVTSWTGGRLEPLTNGAPRVYVRFASQPSLDPKYRALVNKVVGDHDFRSDNPSMQAVEPKVHEIFLRFDIQ